MNKKFLSAVLFGALMVTSTGTFVSCKDYDDDIDNLQGQIDGVKSQLAALEGKINEGKWITSVTPSANGLAITMSDGQTYNITNGKDGANGADGAAGTEWTISEDGFWVCNGEKTDVKAVGQDGAQGEAGKPGADAQPEVKFENGKWFLWDGTQFVEFKGAEATTGNVPYYYEDPSDPNYKILVVFDENGENKHEVRLPMTEGLGQIVVLDGYADLSVVYNTFNGAHFKDGKATDWVVGENAGKKALPKKGEYMLTASQDAYYVQVVPATYDISKLQFKLVNTKGDEAPIKLGTPEPCKEALSRAAGSESGVYAIPFTLPEMTDDVLKAYRNDIAGKRLSLVATDAVRSTYDNYFSTGESDNNSFGSFYGNSNGNYGKQAEAQPYTLSFDYNAGNVYDAFLTMGGDKAKADSVKYGIKIDGMTVSYTGEMPKNHSIAFRVNQINSRAVVSSDEVISIVFNPTEAETIKTIALDAVAPHTPVALKKNAAGQVNTTAQSIVADFEPYFEVVAPTEGDRLIWNQNSTSLSVDKVMWTHVDANGGVVTEEVYDLTAGLVRLNKAGADDKGASVALKDFSKLRIQFTANYGSEDIFNNGTLVATINVWGNNADGDNVVLQKVEVPFSFKAVEATEIASWFNWNAKNSYTAEGLVCYVGTGNTTIKLTDYFAATSSLTKAAELVRTIDKTDGKDEWKPNMSIGYPASVLAGLTTDADKNNAKNVVTWTNFTNPYWTSAPDENTAKPYFESAEIKLGALAAKYFGTYTIGGIKVAAMNRVFDAAGLKVVVKGEASRDDVISYSKALQIPSKNGEYIKLSNSVFAPNAGSFFGSFTLKDYLDRAYELGANTKIAVYATNAKGEMTTESTVIAAEVASYTYTLGSNANNEAQGIQFTYIGTEEYPAGKTFKVFLKIANDVKKDGNAHSEVIVVPATITIGGK